MCVVAKQCVQKGGAGKAGRQVWWWGREEANGKGKKEEARVRQVQGREGQERQVCEMSPRSTPHPCILP